MKYVLTFCVISLIAVSRMSTADILMVPSEYGSIQEGIDAANTGDTVSVEPGMYFESIDFMAKEITVSSVSGTPINTSINGSSSSGSVVVFENGETSNSILEGFTIRNGSAIAGGGIYIYNASPVVRNCVIKDNQASVSGAGIYAASATISLDDVTITNNTANGSGGGIYLKFSQGTISNCTLSNNSAISGGAIYFKDGGEFSLSDTEFEGNSVSGNGGAIYNKNTVADVQGCVFLNNTAESGGAWFSYVSGNATIADSIFADNQATNTGGAATARNSSTVTFSSCTFDSNIADSDCDEKGGSSIAEIVNSTVTLDNPTICNNLVCDVPGDFSGDQPIIVGEILECATGIGACCGGSACWEMDEEMCLDGGGMWNGDATLCAIVTCEGSSGGCAADINGDGLVDVLDIIELISAWGACP